jgi:hypothetical protein
MDALTQAAPRQHSALAWTGAGAVSVAIFSAQFDWALLLIAAWTVIGVVMAFAAARRFAGRSATAAGLTKVALIAFALWTLAIAGWLLILVYPDPQANRAYAEPIGVELGSLLFPALAAAVAIGAWAAWAIDAMGDASPSKRVALRATCMAAPAACVLLAVIPAIWIEEFKGAWTHFGADLPNPTLLVLGVGDWWMAFPIASVALLVLAWLKRESPPAFTGAVAAQLCLVMLCSALMMLAVAAAWLPVFRMCSAI